MAIKHLSFDNQRVAHFLPYDEHDNFSTFNIRQDAQVSCAQFKLSQWIGA
jgi:hypothetical protein